MLISPFGGFKEGKLSPLNRCHEGKEYLSILLIGF